MNPYAWRATILYMADKSSPWDSLVGFAVIIGGLLLYGRCEEQKKEAKAAADREAEKERAQLFEQERARDRAIQFDICMLKADNAYWEYVQLNARVAKRSASGITYKAPSHVWEQASRDKLNAIEECKARWK